MADHIIRCLLGDGAARLCAAVTTDLSIEAARRHGVGGGVAVLLSRAASAGILLATLTKGGERVSLQLVGDGPVGGLTADASDHGGVRVYARAPATPVPVVGPGRARLGWALGRNGTVQVIRDLGLRERYSGQSPLVSGEVDEDVEGYLESSEQIESALACDAVVDEDGALRAAGAVLVQCMPGGAGSELVAALRERLRAGALHAALAAGTDGGAPTAETIARAVLGEHAASLDVIDLRPLRFHCPCSRERVLGMLELLSTDELAAMLRDDGGAEVTCNFCSERYAVDAEELARIVHGRGPAPGGGGTFRA